MCVETQQHLAGAVRHRYLPCRPLSTACTSTVWTGAARRHRRTMKLLNACPRINSGQGVATSPSSAADLAYRNPWQSRRARRAR